MAATVVGPTDGHAIDLGGLGVRYLIRSEDTGGRFALVEHPIAPRTLAAAMHIHEREDEYSFVLEGRVGVQLGDEVLEAGPGDLVYKPRGQWHAFWNATDGPARMLELISPGGFERFFEEMAGVLESPPPDEQAIGALMDRYALTMDFTTGADLAARHGLRNQF